MDRGEGPFLHAREEEPEAQAASVAHYKKMYDRSSALARIGVWECDLATEQLTWTDGVYDLFELPPGSPLERTTRQLVATPFVWTLNDTIADPAGSLPAASVR